MRQALLIAITLPLCVIAPFAPEMGLYAYTWFALMRPDVLAWGSGLPYSFVLAAATLLGSLRYAGNFIRLFDTPISLALVCLQFPIAASVLFAQDTMATHDPFKQYMRMMVMAFLIPLLMVSLEDLRRLLLVMGISLGLLGTRFGLYGLIHGGVRFNAGYGGMLADNNCLALALVMGVPLCWYGRFLVKRLWLKQVYTWAAIISLPAIVMTYSRGAALSLAAVLLVLAVRAKRKFAAGLILVMIAGGSVFLVGRSYLSRMQTIKAPTEEGSAAARLAYAGVAFRMWKDHPIAGVGYGMTNEMKLMPYYITNLTEHGEQVIHDTYLQMLCDSGIFAFLIYVGLLWGTIAWLGLSVHRMKRSHPELAPYPMMLQTSLLGFAIGSTFLSRIEFDLIWMLLLASAVWYRIERQLRSKPTAGSSAADWVFEQPAPVVIEPAWEHRG